MYYIVLSLLQRKLLQSNQSLNFIDGCGGWGGEKTEKTAKTANATTIVAFPFFPPLLASPQTLQPL